MSDIKYCPNCQKEVSIKAEVYEDCGFQFAPEKEKEVSGYTDKQYSENHKIVEEKVTLIVKQIKEKKESQAKRGET